MGQIEGYYIMPHPPIIISDVGKGEGDKAKNTIEACTEVAKEIKKIKPNTIIIISPHGPLFRDAISIMGEREIIGDLTKFGAENVKFNVKINKSLSEALGENCSREGIPAVTIDNKRSKFYDVKRELDHGAMVPLYFINKEFNEYNLVHITYGLLDDVELYRFGKVLKRTIEEVGERVVIVASGDLSHRLREDGPYGYSEDGVRFDRKIIEYLKEGKVEEIFSMDKREIEGAGECGLRSFNILLGAVGNRDFKGELLSYEAPFGIGYAVMKLKVYHNEIESNILEKIIRNRKEKIKKIREKESLYVKLARESLENFIKTGEYISIPSYMTEESLSQKRGVFVSLKKEGELRGCIGTVIPVTSNVAQEIIKNAVEAGERDPRFNPVDEEELDFITYSVDEIMPFEKCTINDLNPKKYGVIISSSGKSGLLLPDLEGVNTVEQQISIALRKGEINPKEDYSIERFEVIRHV